MLQLAAPDPFVDARETCSSVECRPHRLPSVAGASGARVRGRAQLLLRFGAAPSAAVDAGRERCGRAFGARLAVRVPGERSDPFVFAQHVRASKARLHRRWRPLPAGDAAILGVRPAPARRRHARIGDAPVPLSLPAGAVAQPGRQQDAGDDDPVHAVATHAPSRTATAIDPSSVTSRASPRAWAAFFHRYWRSAWPSHRSKTRFQTRIAATSATIAGPRTARHGIMRRPAGGRRRRGR